MFPAERQDNKCASGKLNNDKSYLQTMKEDLHCCQRCGISCVADRIMQSILCKKGDLSLTLQTANHNMKYKRITRNEKFKTTVPS